MNDKTQAQRNDLLNLTQDLSLHLSDFIPCSFSCIMQLFKYKKQYQFERSYN